MQQCHSLLSMFLRTVSSFFKESLCRGFMEWILSSVFSVTLEVTSKASL